jgi:hypothetical protein
MSKQTSVAVGARTVMHRCGHQQLVIQWQGEKLENFDRYATRQERQVCLACRRALWEEKHPEGLCKAKFRLPDQSVFRVEYDQSNQTWSGTLIVRTATGVKTYRGQESSVHLLLSKLGWTWFQESKGKSGKPGPDVGSEGAGGKSVPAG